MGTVTIGLARIKTDSRVRVFSSYDPVLKDALKGIPGARWDPKGKCWHYPCSPVVAPKIIEALHDNNYQPQWDENFDNLLHLARAHEKAQGNKEASAEDLLQPEVRKTDAWLHQLRGYNFAKTLPATLLAMYMGTGKSKTAIDILQNMDGVSRVLILCPMSVTEVWPKEFEKHAVKEYNLTVLNKGSVKKRAEQAEKTLSRATENNPAIIVINYESAWREPLGASKKGSKGLFLNVEWDLVIADEIHKIKAPGGKCSRFCSKLNARKKLGLTGTPLPHSPLDAYAQFRFLDPAVFGTSNLTFKNRYAVTKSFRNFEKVVGYQNMDDFYEKFYSITFRAEKDVLDLPEAVHVERYCSMSPKNSRVYEQMKEDLRTWLNEMSDKVSANNVLTKLLRLAQIADGFVKNDEGRIQELGDHKDAILKETIDEIEASEAVVVFARFQHDLDSIAGVCRDLDRPCYELSGRVNERQEWQEFAETNPETAPVIAVQIQAGGVGIDLTMAHYCIYYSVGYSLGDYEQSEARVHRPGQERNVTYVHLITQNTVDEDIYEALDGRREIVNSVLNGYGMEVEI